MQRQFLLKALLIPAFLFCFFASVPAFTGSGGPIDSNWTSIFYAADWNASSSDNAIKTSFVIGMIPSGGWSNGSFRAQEGIYFDQNLPVVSILSPSNNETVSSDSVTVTYAGTSIGNPIAKYWVKLNSSDYIDNGLNTGYTFSGLINGTNTIYIKAMDLLDLNSIEYSVVVAKSADAGTVTGGPVIGNETYPEPHQNVWPKTAFDEMNNSEKNSFAGKRMAWPEEIRITRKFERTTGTAQIGNNPKKSQFTITVENISGRALENVGVVEYIPKEIAQKAAEITFEKNPSRIIRPDPIFEWDINYFSAGDSTEFVYWIDGKNEPGLLNDINSFMSISPVAFIPETPTERDACAAKDCNDNNPCTNDYCSNGRCLHTQSNGLPCGTAPACDGGTCGEETPLQFDWAPIGIAALVLLALATAIMAKRAGKGKSKG